LSQRLLVQHDWNSLKKRKFVVLPLERHVRHYHDFHDVRIQKLGRTVGGCFEPVCIINEKTTSSTPCFAQGFEEISQSIARPGVRLCSTKSKSICHWDGLVPALTIEKLTHLAYYP